MLWTGFMSGPLAGQGREGVNPVETRRLAAALGVTVCLFAAGALVGQDDAPVTPFLRAPASRTGAQGTVGPGEECLPGDGSAHQTVEQSDCREAGATGQGEWSAARAR
jgi:hypothetical protein